MPPDRPLDINRFMCCTLELQKLLQNRLSFREIRRDKSRSDFHDITAWSVHKSTEKSKVSELIIQLNQKILVYY